MLQKTAVGINIEAMPQKTAVGTSLEAMSQKTADCINLEAIAQKTVVGINLEAMSQKTAVGINLEALSQKTAVGIKLEAMTPDNAVLDCSQPQEEDLQPILREEVEITVESLKRGSLLELIIYQQNLFNLAGRPWLICDSIWRTWEWPTQWTQSLMITFPKRATYSSARASELSATSIIQTKSCWRPPWTSRKDNCWRTGWVQHGKKHHKNRSWTITHRVQTRIITFNPTKTESLL